MDAISRNKINRYLVVEVVTQTRFEMDRLGGVFIPIGSYCMLLFYYRTELVLKLKEKSEERLCYLRDDW